jgi:hypothetical protein
MTWIRGGGVTVQERRALRFAQQKRVEFDFDDEIDFLRLDLSVFYCIQLHLKSLHRAKKSRGGVHGGK